MPSPIPEKMAQSEKYCMSSSYKRILTQLNWREGDGLKGNEGYPAL